MRAAGAALTLVLASCGQHSEFYPVPAQRQPLEAFRPYRVTRIVDMADDIEPRIASDITAMSGGTWRWTLQRPAVRVTLPSTANLRYLIEFAIYDRAFADNGPLTVSYFVNDRVLDRVTYQKPGQQHFEKEVPADWMQPNRETIVAAHLDKTWLNPNGGAKLGVLLLRLGLTE